MLTCNGFTAALLSESLHEVFYALRYCGTADMWGLSQGCSGAALCITGHLPSTHRHPCKHPTHQWCQPKPSPDVTRCTPV